MYRRYCLQLYFSHRCFIIFSNLFVVYLFLYHPFYLFAPSYLPSSVICIKCIYFQTGHRQCPRESLPCKEIILLTAKIFKKFSVQLPPGAELDKKRLRFWSSYFSYPKDYFQMQVVEIQKCPAIHRVRQPLQNNLIYGYIIKIQYFCI